MNRAVSAICAAAAPSRKGRPFVAKGEPMETVEELVDAFGTDTIKAWLTTSPKGLIVPSLLAWLVNQAHLPNAEFLAALEARPDDQVPTDADQDGGDETVVRVPEAFTGHHYDDDPDNESTGETADEARAKIRALRGARPSDPDATMGGATGGA